MRPAPVRAENGEELDYILGRPMTEEEIEEQKEHEIVSQSHRAEFAHSVGVVDKEHSPFSRSRAICVPEAFDHRDGGRVTSVKDQSPYSALSIPAEAGRA